MRRGCQAAWQWLPGSGTSLLWILAGGPGAEGGNRIGIEAFAGEQGDKQERRVVDAVIRGNIEFLAGEKTREIGVGVDRREMGKKSHYPEFGAGSPDSGR